MSITLYIAMGVTLFCGVGLLLTPILVKPSVAEKRLLDVVQSCRPDERAIGGHERFQNRLLAAARRLRSTLGMSVDGRLSQRLSRAGFRSGSLDLYLAARVLSPMLGAALGTLLHGNTFMGIMLGTALGYVAPDLWLRAMIKRRRERIRKGVPDAIDLLAICVDAGLGLDQALLRVGEEMQVSSPDIHDEFAQINLEQRAGKPRLEAWQSMAARTELPEIAAFVTMLMQTERFGTPISKALSRLSDDIRMKRRQRAEELAAKSKIKILFPLVFFIFPCIFIV